MITPKRIVENRHFSGRDFERKKLARLAHAGEASIIVVYGRRRVGKTELIEQTYRKRNILKFEGIEGGSEQQQRQQVLWQLSEYLHDPLIAKLRLTTWTELFQLISQQTAKGVWTLFFDEVQWLAAYRTRFVAELKFVWDNYFRQNSSLLLILCGSSPSFIINKVLHSKALYNRSQHEIPLQEFILEDARAFLKKPRSLRETMDAMLTVGGIPEYLKYLDADSSVFLGLCKETFTQGAFFSNEYQRIFSSSLANHPDYIKVIRMLSRRPHATRNDIARSLRTTTGGYLTQILRDLELCGFITKYVPFQLGAESLVVRYHISDAYLQFYFKFVEPHVEEIQMGRFNQNPTRPLNRETYDQWLGFGFERFCRRHHHRVAHVLGFDAVSYTSGAFFNREVDRAKRGFQIDLVFERKDKVYTVCEIKYGRSPVTKRVIHDVEQKLRRFPNTRRYTLEKVLITAQGVEPALERAAYFDRVMTLEDLFGSV
ncbi:MAG: AAA family ATPase [Deltaproteobacteria bacterium]|nr:AAA family ATPase [Deltaproteobacteria bacterium]